MSCFEAKFFVILGCLLVNVVQNFAKLAFREGNFHTHRLPIDISIEWVMGRVLPIAIRWVGR